MSGAPLWRLAEEGDGYGVVPYAATKVDPSEAVVERQEQLRCISDTTRAALEELSNIFGRAVDEIKVARSLVPMEDAEGDGCRPCRCDAWQGVLAGLSWSYAAHTSCLVRQAAAMLSLLASADEEVRGDTG